MAAWERTGEGLRALKLSQGVSRAGVYLPVYRHTLTAIYSDSGQQLVGISGKVRTDLPSAISADAIGVASALAVVSAAESTRVVITPPTLVGRAIARVAASSYHPVYVVDVELSAPSEARQYAISALDGRVVSRRALSHSSAWSSAVPVGHVDPNLLVGNDRIIKSGSGALVDGPTSLPINDTAPYRLRKFEDLGNGHVGYGTVRVTEFFYPNDSFEPSWASANFAAPSLEYASQLTPDARLKLFTAYYWIDHALSTMGAKVGGVSPIVLRVDEPLTDPDDTGAAYSGGFLRPGRIILRRETPAVSDQGLPYGRLFVYAAVHEALHHIVDETVDFDTTCTDETCAQDPEGRMPNGLNEGLADFFAEVTLLGPPDNTVGVVSALLLCTAFAAGGDNSVYIDCINRGAANYRVPRAFWLERPDEANDLLVEWPSCSGTNIPGCLSVARPGRTSTFRWAPDPPSNPYTLINQTMVRAWERLGSDVMGAELRSNPGAGTAKADCAVAEFVTGFGVALNTSPADASFHEYRDVLSMASRVAMSLGSCGVDLAMVDRSLDRSFAEQGIDIDLLGFCGEDPDACH